MPERVPGDRRRASLLVAAVAVSILVASVVRIPGKAPVEPGLVSLTDPFHVVGYAALAMAVATAFATARGVTPRALLVAATLATLYGVGVEVVQAPLPWRSLAAVDVAVNALGAVLGVVTLRAWYWRRGDREFRTAGR